MDPDFWQQRWRDNRIGFHRDGVLPLLEKHWPSLGLATGSRVFVPLCGKSLDMAWLAARGHRVLGVELSPLAVGQFFDENGLAPRSEEHTSELQSLMRISYAVFCLKKKKYSTIDNYNMKPKNTHT